ncbi:MAG: Ig-like domain-containing protein [Aeromonas sp.]
MTRLLTFLLGACLLAGCDSGGGSGGNGGGSGSNGAYSPNLSITPNHLTVPTGVHFSLPAIHTNANGVQTDVSQDSVTQWQVNNDKVVSRKQGHFFSHQAGTTKVNATYPGVNSAQVSVIVTDAQLTEVALAPNPVQLPVGLMQQVSAQGVFKNADASELQTFDVTLGMTGWTSAQPAIASIDQYGMITARSAGTTTISATHPALNGQVFSLSVTVLDTQFESLTIMTEEQREITLLPGSTQTIFALASFSDGSRHDVSAQATWHNANNSVAQFNLPVPAGQQAQLLAKQAGNTQVHATLTLQNKSLQSNSLDAAVLDPSEVQIIKLQVAPGRLDKLPVGAVRQMQVIAWLNNNTSFDASQQVVWHSSDDNRVSVDRAAQLHALSTGEVTISASLSIDGQTPSQSNDVTVDVVSLEVKALNITPNIVSLPVGIKQKLTANATYSDGLARPVTHHVSWVSSDTNIARVGNDGRVQGISPGTVQVQASLRNGDGTIINQSAEVTVTDGILQSVSISPKHVTLPIAAQHSFTATAHYSDGSEFEVSNSAMWSVADPLIASVTGSGRVTALSTGNTTIYAMRDGKVTEAATVSVTDAQIKSIRISPAGSSLHVGQNQQLQAIATYSDDSERNVNAEAIWQSSDSSIVGVDNKGKAYANRLGNADVSAWVHGLHSAPAQILVNEHLEGDFIPDPVIGFTIAPNRLTVPLGVNFSLPAIASYADGRQEDVSQSLVLWDSPAVDGIDILGSGKSGKISALNAGTATLKATLEGSAHQDELVSTAIVTVSDAHLTRVTLLPNALSLPVGASQKILAMGIYDDGTTFDVTTNMYQWKTANPRVAEFQGGKLIAKAAGKTTLSAVHSGFNHDDQSDDMPASNEIEIEVTDVNLISLQISTQNLRSINLLPGMQQRLQAIATYSDGSSREVTKDVVWSSSAANVANFTQPGLIQALAKGHANLSARLLELDSNIVVANVLDVSSVGLESISVTPGKVTNLPLGTRQQLTATAFLTDNSSLDITEQASWYSNANTIVNVDMRGEVYATAEGSSEITASLTLNGKKITSNSVEVTVTAADLLRLELSPGRVKDLPKGGYHNLTAIAHYSDGNSHDVSSIASWNSSNPQIVTVDRRGKVHAFNLGTADIEATLRNGTGTVRSNKAEVNVTNAIVIALQINPGDNSVAIGGTQQLTASAQYSDGSQRDVSDQVSWLAKDNNVVTVSGLGLVKGITQGETSVLATLSGVKSNYAKLRVTDAHVISIQLSASRLRLPVGAKFQLKAIATYSDTSTRDISSNASWFSSNSDIAWLTPKGAIFANNVGNADIHAEFGGVRSHSAIVTVSDAVLQSIVITPALLTLPEGLSMQLSATGIYSDFSSIDITDSVNWRTQDHTIVTINQDGLLQAENRGSTTIQANLNGINSNLASVQVTNATLIDLRVSPLNSTLPKGHTQQLSAVARYSDGSKQDVTTQASWLTTDVNLATVSNDGLLTAIAKGRTQVQANLNGKLSNQANINVTDAVLRSIQISPARNKLIIGNSTALKAITYYSDNSSLDATNFVSWHSADSLVASISQAGVLQAEGVGNTTISAASIDGSISSNIAVLEVTDATMTQLVITPTVINNLQISSTKQLRATATFDNHTVQDVTNSVTWQVAHPSIATTNRSGLLYGVSAGKTTVEAISRHGFKSSNRPEVTVSGARIIKLEVRDINGDPYRNLPIGMSMQLTATAFYDDGSSQNVSDSVIWSVTNDLAADISDKGLLTSLADRDAPYDIYCSYIHAEIDGIRTNEMGESYDMCGSSATPIALEIIPGDVTMLPGMQTKLKVMATLSDGNLMQITDSVNLSYQVADTNIATVDNIGSAYGTLTAVALGDTEITAFMGKLKSQPSKIHVKNTLIKDIWFKNLPAQMEVGKVYPIEIEVELPDGSLLPLHPVNVHASSSNEAILIAENTLKELHPVVAGTVEVSISYTDPLDYSVQHTDSAIVTVVNP